MGYVLLTGVTGLVGRHVLRELLTEDVPVAAMVRPGKGPAVLEGIMNLWEQQARRALPRPVVIEGDLCDEAVVPDARQRRWIAGNCDRILHSAASMSFREDRRGEPFRTNIDGTKRLLELCRSTGIRRFHHVSTAYICGLRQGAILETDLDVGQELGNVYEKSKLEAEKLIRGAGFLDQLTVYRPASVVGDSRTGYVTNFHGFYLPLQLAHVMAGRVPVREMNERFFAQLGLRGDEGKNLVPVDWLAKVITWLFTHPQHHGKTYHLASPHPVPVVELQRVIRDAIEQYYPKPLAKSISEEELKSIEGMFYEYMLIYRSHWRDDPKFDLTNLRAAVPHLPCPEMSYDVMMRVAKFPVERNFVPPRHESAPPDYDVRAHLAALVDTKNVQTPEPNTGEIVGLQVNGPGGGQWHVRLDGDRVADVDWGLPSPPAPCFYLSAALFRSLANGAITIEQAINSGRLLVDGSGNQLGRLIGCLEQIVSVGGGVDRSTLATT